MEQLFITVLDEIVVQDFYFILSSNLPHCCFEMSAEKEIHLDVKDGGSFLLYPTDEDYQYQDNVEKPNAKNASTLCGQFCSYIKLTDEDASNLIKYINLNVLTDSNHSGEIGTIEFKNESNGVEHMAFVLYYLCCNLLQFLFFLIC